jgi:hypothetical protein
VGNIDAVLPTADIVARLRDEYREAAQALCDGFVEEVRV